MKHLITFILLTPLSILAQPFNAILDLKTPGAHLTMDPNQGNPIPNNEDFTIEFWFRTCGTLEGTAYIIDHRSGANNDGIELSYNTDTEKFTLRAQSNGVETQVQQDYLLTNMLDGLFRHYVIEYKHSEERFRLYMNGTLAAQGSNMPHGLNTGPLHIGCSSENVDEQFTGEIDGLRISLGLLYDSITYTPPTNELTALPQTTALWNFNQPEGFLNFPDVVSIYFLNGTPEVKIIDPIITGDISACIGQLLTLDGHSGFSVYQWQSDFNNINPSNAEDPNSTFLESSYYSLNAFQGICNYEETILITSFNPDGSVLPGTTICSGDTAVLTAFNADTYSWMGPNIVEGAESPTALVMPTSTSEYYVYMEIFPGCGEVDTVTVFVNPSPTTEAIPLSDTICVNQNEVVFLSTFNDIGTTFSWEPTTGVDCPTCLNPSITVNETTTYTITSTSALGCSSEYSFTIFGEDCNSIYELTDLSTLAFPNPTTGKIILKGIDLQTPFSLYSAMGKLIIQESYQGCIDLNSLPQGLYFLRLSGAYQNISIPILKNI
jgi:hypothetical protein